MTLSQLQWHLDGGGTATLLTSDGVQAKLRANRSFPPGSTLLAHELPSSPTADSPLQVKVRDCTREPSGAFCISGRFVSLPKRTRVRLLEALASPAR